MKCQLITFMLLICHVHAQQIPGYVDKHIRVDCHPEPGATEANCRQRGCTWSWESPDPMYVNIQNTSVLSPRIPAIQPACFYPPNTGYTVDGSIHDSPISLIKNRSS